MTGGVIRMVSVLGGLLWAAPSGATPSTTFWAPSTPAVQPFGVLHVTYDTFFRAKAAYPIDVGLEAGLLPFEKLQLEAGFDLLYPTFGMGDAIGAPLLLNAKLGGPEDAYFDRSPAWSVGVFGVGFKEDVTDYDIVYGMIGKTLPVVGTLSVGGYYGLNANLLVDAEGDAHQLGLLAGWFSAAIDVPYLDHINLAADVQTGNNVFGAVGAGVYVYVTPNVDLLLGPVFFFEGAVQPGGSDWLWSVQLDLDIDFNRKAAAD
jgi:hypothetical protein